MLDNEERRLAILYDSRIRKLSVNEIAEKYDVHRNTVTNIKKAYAELSDKDICEFHRNPSKALYVFRKKRAIKITQEERDFIKKICEANLNCYRTPIDICKSLCKKNGVKSQDVIMYYEILRAFGDFKGCTLSVKADYISKIHNIMKKHHPPKNFQEVYCDYYLPQKAEDDWKISYSCFYYYAQEYWEDVSWGRKTLKDLIEEQKANQKK